MDNCPEVLARVRWYKFPSTGTPESERDREPTFERDVGLRQYISHFDRGLILPRLRHLHPCGSEMLPLEVPSSLYSPKEQSMARFAVSQS